MNKMVVGVDGSPGSSAALEWAVATAERLGSSLEVVLCWELRAAYFTPHPPMPQFERETEERAQAALDALVLAAEVPADAECHLVQGPAAPTLVRMARGADLLVVGAHGSDGIMPGVGSTATRCAVRNTVPTVVVPASGRAADDGPVVVGIDGSAAGGLALRTALELSEDDRPIIGVSAWSVPAVTGPAISVLDPHLFETAAQEALDMTMASIEDERDSGRVTTRLCQGSPRSVLREQSEDASMVVIGSRGHSTLLHRILGSVATYLLHHHPTVVVIVPVDMLD